MPQHTTAKVQVAASMATLIAVACDERIMAANGRWLIHNPWSMAMGDHAEMAKNATLLKEAKDEAAEFYSKRTGMDVEAVNALMDEERWMRASEAKELGFVNEIADPFEVEDFAEMAAEIAARGKWPVALVLDESDESDGGEADGDQEEEDTEGDGVDEGADGGGAPDDDGDNAADGEPEPAAEPEPDGGESPDVEVEPQSLEGDDVSRMRLYEAVETAKAKIEELRAELVKERESRDKLEADHKAEVQVMRKLQSDLEARLARLLPGMADSSIDETAPAPKTVNECWKPKI